MNAKKNKFMACLLIAVFLSLLFLPGCSTTNGAAGNLQRETIAAVARNSYIDGQMAAAIDFIDGSIDRNIGRIESVIATSRELAEDVARFKYLFGEFERIAFGLLADYERVRNMLADEGAENSGAEIGNQEAENYNMDRNSGVPVDSGGSDFPESQVRG